LFSTAHAPCLCFLWGIRQPNPERPDICKERTAIAVTGKNLYCGKGKCLQPLLVKQKILLRRAAEIVEMCFALAKSYGAVIG